MTWGLRQVKSHASVHFFMALLDSNPASNHWEHTLDRELHQCQWASKNKESVRDCRPGKGFTWVYTVETTCVDTLKMAFPASTHFTSAPFCQTEKERKSPTVRLIFIPSHVWYFSFFLFFGLAGYLGVAGFLDSQVSRRQVARDWDVKLLGRQAPFFEQRQPRVPHWKGTNKHKATHNTGVGNSWLVQPHNNRLLKSTSLNYSSRYTTASPGVSRDSFRLALVLALMSQVTW